MPVDRQQLLMEFDREKRAQYLLELKSSEQEQPSDTDVYLRLHEFRFANNKGRYYDRFIKFWLELVFLSGRLNTASGIRAAKNEAPALLRDERLLEIIKTDEQRETILYDELLNSILLYFKTSVSDSNFNSYAFGLMKLDNKALMGKIAQQAEQIAAELPEKTGLTEEFSLVSRAVTEGFDIFRKNMWRV